MRIETAVGKVLENSFSMSARPSKREKSKIDKPSPVNFLDALIPPINKNVAK